MENINKNIFRSSIKLTVIVLFSFIGINAEDINWDYKNRKYIPSLKLILIIFS